MNHGDYGSQNTGVGSHSTGGSSRCDLQYCGTTCLQYAYCADPTKQDANCANAPTDCAERCSGCGDADAAVQNGGGGGGSAHGSQHTGSVPDYNTGSMDHGHTGSDYGKDDSSMGGTTGSMPDYNTGSMNHGDYGSQNTGVGSHSTGGSTRCDLQYCGTTCLQYAYCADPTKQD